MLNYSDVYPGKVRNFDLTKYFQGNWRQDCKSGDPHKLVWVMPAKGNGKTKKRESKVKVAWGHFFSGLAPSQ